MTIRDIIKRDIGVKVEGVVKVFDHSTLVTEFREYVVTDKIEDEVKKICDTFTQVSETLRRGGKPRDVMGIWVSGFFGSGKSHFAKVLGYLLQNDELRDETGERCIDVFCKHLSDTPRGQAIRLRLGEVKHTTHIKTIAFEIRSRQSLTNPNSVGEILLSEFYRHIGLSENFVVARIERRLDKRGLLTSLEQTYEARFRAPWRSPEGRDDLMTVRRRLADLLPEIDPTEYPDQREARRSLEDMFRHEKITAEGIADELVAWVDAQPTTGGRVQHLVFVIDEMGTFIGDSHEKIGELNSLAEMIGNKGKGKVWLIVTSQQDLEKVVDRTNFQPALVGRLHARFEGIPRTSYELSVINQFYTPSWVVKVLVDNTLGRLWLQMHPDSALRSEGPPPLPDARTSDGPVADYLVPQTGEKLRYQRLTEDGQIETYKQARDITLLDPACGTMHFGQYAFGPFYRMYLDEIAHASTPGWPTEPSVKDPEDIPVAIIENNLFGIDIDPRAIQIASLSLLLTAKEAALRHGYAPQDVHISRTNLVVANAVNLGEERLRAMVKRLGPRLGSVELQERLFKTVWENLQYVGELGSLIQVREGVTRVLDDWVEQQAKQQGLTRLAWPQQEQQLELGTIRSDAIRQQAYQMDLQRRLLEKEATELRRELLDGVEAAAAEAGADPAQRLFAEDTARGLKLLEVLSRHYDVVVMNPPYGAFVPQVSDLVRAAYPLTYNNIYATFINRATQLVEPEGYVGALVSATFVNLKTFEKLRTEILLKRNPLIAMLDLGFGILDEATVEAAAVVLRGRAL